MSDTCIPHHDYFNALLTFGLCCGLIISYLPQHFRIIHTKSSEGFSPIFLLLGTASAAAAMFNMITLQTPIVKCCRVVSFGSCMEMTAGVIQVGLQWICFTFVFVLYMIYYPEHLKYLDSSSEENEALLRPSRTKDRVKSPEWRLSIVVAWIAAIHFTFLALTTIYLLSTSPQSPTASIPPQISGWATFLGLSSAMFATVQYAPQLIHTYRTKLVGALSIPMMMIQTPGGVLMVTSIALRPGTNWTSWITFAVAAVLQGCLLFMCIAWKLRQQKLDIDDFGNPLGPEFPPAYWSHTDVDETLEVAPSEELMPGLVTTPSEDPLAVQSALAAALESAAESDLRESAAVQTQAAGEDSSLLAKRDPPKKSGEERAWFGR